MIERKRITKLTDAIKKELLVHKPIVEKIHTQCFGCGASYTYRSNRFCSIRCQEIYDALPYVIRKTIKQYPDLKGYPMKTCGHGFTINCSGCGKEFKSIGLSYCSDKCETKSKRKRELAEDMKTSGVYIDTKRRKCECCGNLLPRWSKGKALRVSVRFCSPACKRRAKAGVVFLQQNEPENTLKWPESSKGPSERYNAKKPLCHNNSQQGPRKPQVFYETPSQASDWKPTSSGIDCPPIPDFLQRK